MTKNEIRKAVKKLLQNSADCLPELSQKSCSTILASKEYSAAQIVLAYMALPDEVNLDAVITLALQDSKKVYIPRIVPNTSEMNFFEYSGKGNTAEGSFGIQEPSENLPEFRTESTDAHILVLVPGRAFTKNGERLGRGKGFYDTFLGKLKQAAGNLCVAGVCFPCQILEELPVEEHDIKMDIIFTAD